MRLKLQLQAFNRLPPSKSPPRSLPRRLKKLCRLVLAASAALFVPAQAMAQDHSAPLRPGDAIVTNFSGVVDTGASSEADPAAGLAINPDGNSAVILRLGDAPAVAPNTIKPPIVRAFKASEIGQVFPIAHIGGGDNDIFFGATSAFGLQIVKQDPAGGPPIRLKTGGPEAQWMEGQWGAGGEPGSIWQVKANGDVRLFANLPGNSGAGIGGLAINGATGHVYASDLSTGLIYNLDARGTIVSTFDHGVEGRPNSGEAPISDDPSTHSSIRSPSFNTEDPSTWGFTPVERQVWALALSQGRLFYAAGDGGAIWSVSLNSDGSFGHDPRREIEIQSDFKNRITSMFLVGRGPDRHLYAAQRGQLAPSFDFSSFARPGEAQVLRFVADAGSDQWVPAPQTYAVGHTPEFNNSAGGVYRGCPLRSVQDQPPAKALLWSTIDGIIQPEDQSSVQPSSSQQPGQAEFDQNLRHGLQGNDPSLVRPTNIPPDNATFAIYGEDIVFEIPGFMGDIKILTCGAQPDAQFLLGQVEPEPEIGLEPGPFPWPGCPDGLCRGCPPGTMGPQCCPRGTFPQPDGQCGPIHKVCPPGLVHEPNGKCCRPGSVALPDGKCCPPGSHPHDGKCGCPPGTHPEGNGRCGACPRGTYPQPNGTCGSCPGGARPEPDGKCPCPQGMVRLTDGSCKPRTVLACQPGFTGTPPNCVRCNGRIIQGRCAPERILTLTCPAGRRPVNGQCIVIPCARGMTRIGDVCRPQSTPPSRRPWLHRPIRTGNTNIRNVRGGFKAFGARRSQARSPARSFVRRRAGGGGRGRR